VGVRKCELEQRQRRRQKGIPTVAKFVGQKNGRLETCHGKRKDQNAAIARRETREDLKNKPGGNSGGLASGSKTVKEKKYLRRG